MVELYRGANVTRKVHQSKALFTVCVEYIWRPVARWVEMRLPPPHPHHYESCGGSHLEILPPAEIDRMITYKLNPALRTSVHKKYNGEMWKRGLFVFSRLVRTHNLCV